VLSCSSLQDIRCLWQRTNRAICLQNDGFDPQRALICATAALRLTSNQDNPGQWNGQRTQAHGGSGLLTNQ
jgi:hypothetical protein